jgi:hypothetical protein
MCDPAEQSQSQQWNQCSVVVDPSVRDITPDQGWAFQYAKPVVLSITGVVSTSGGEVLVSGYNFGEFTEDIVAWMQPRISGRARMDLVPVPGTNISSDIGTGIQSFSLLIGPGLGVNWTITFSVKDQEVNMSTPEMVAPLLFSYEAPVVTSLSRTTGSTMGGYNVTVYGRNFGSLATLANVGGAVYVEDSLDGAASIGFPPVAARMVEANQTAITFVMPPSQGLKRVYVLCDSLCQSLSLL